jgi:hypothetical protein
MQRQPVRATVRLVTHFSLKLPFYCARFSVACTDGAAAQHIGEQRRTISSKSDLGLTLVGQWLNGFPTQAFAELQKYISELGHSISSEVDGRVKEDGRLVSYGYVLRLYPMHVTR